MNVEAAVNLFLTAKTGEVSAATVRWYRSHLKALSSRLGSREIAQVTIYELREWRVQVLDHKTRYDDHPFRPTANTRGLAPTTAHDRIKVARIFFAWLVEEGLVERDPSVRLQPPKKPRNQEPKAIPDVDIRKLRMTAFDLGLVREVALLHCLADTGARVGGIAALTLSDVNQVTGELMVTEKGEKTRPVYLLPEGVTALREWLRVRPNVDHDSVFVGRSGEPLTHTGIYQALMRLAEQAGVERANPHSFRHAFARELLNAGLSLEAVSDLMGHSGVAITAENYAVWTQSELRKKHKEAGQRRNLWRDKQ